MKYLRVSLACLALIGCGRPTELEACNIANKSCQIDVYVTVTVTVPLYAPVACAAGIVTEPPM